MNRVKGIILIIGLALFSLGVVTFCSSFYAEDITMNFNLDLEESDFYESAGLSKTKYEINYNTSIHEIDQDVKATRIAIKNNGLNGSYVDGSIVIPEESKDVITYALFGHSFARMQTISAQYEEMADEFYGKMALLNVMITAYMNNFTVMHNEITGKDDFIITPDSNVRFTSLNSTTFSLNKHVRSDIITLNKHLKKQSGYDKNDSNYRISTFITNLDGTSAGLVIGSIGFLTFTTTAVLAVIYRSF